MPHDADATVTAWLIDWGFIKTLSDDGTLIGDYSAARKHLHLKSMEEQVKLNHSLFVLFHSYDENVNERGSNNV